MKLNKSLDGYYVYSTKKNTTEVFFADNINYRNSIDELINNLDGLQFDSLIIIFGLDSGAYLEFLYSELCAKNNVIIFEPNEEIFNSNRNLKLKKNVKVILFTEETVKYITSMLINEYTFDNLYLHAFGNYKEIYADEYNKLIENIDSRYFAISGNILLSYRCKESFMRNSICNLKIINNSTPINSYLNCNMNVPAIVVSAGPSLDLNIKELVKNIDKVKDYFIIATNRTFATLLKHGIKPDLLVVIDPSDAIYDMMKDNLNQDIPLLFYEYSNRYLVEEYQGEKIYVSTTFSKVIDEVSDVYGLAQGGSVAHTCIGMANFIGCNPIILVGQDLALTFDKHHSSGAIFDIDNTFNYEYTHLVKDVFGKDIKTTATFRVFKESMESYIKFFKANRDVNFINASYGADIIGAPHEELKDILNTDNFLDKKTPLKADKTINLDYDKIIISILKYIDEYIVESEHAIEQCTILINLETDKSLMDTDGNDIDFQRFLFVFDILKRFESNLENFYLGQYFNKFLFSIKRESFSMKAKDFEKYTSSMKYQGKAFLNYFEKMKEMLIEAKNIILEEVTKNK